MVGAVAVGLLVAVVLGAKSEDTEEDLRASSAEMAEATTTKATKKPPTRSATTPGSTSPHSTTQSTSTTSTRRPKPRRTTTTSTRRTTPRRTTATSTKRTMPPRTKATSTRRTTASTTVEPTMTGEGTATVVTSKDSDQPAFTEVQTEETTQPRSTLEETSTQDKAGRATIPTHLHKFTEPCDSINTNSSGYIGTINSFRNMTRVTWCVASRPGTVISAYFVNLNLREEQPCVSEYVRFYDGGGSGAPIITTACGVQPPPPFATTGNILYVVYVRSRDVRMGDFKLRYYPTPLTTASPPE
ncbi:integumentary mucin C.1-like isoform X1 [Ornithodoros turicata]|uniref:integumentary mucin C.1-like isoform X1 n=1 Tax=Ornithodoros turicata TaxID=34597 RepID=UPI0031386E56